MHGKSPKSKNESSKAAEYLLERLYTIEGVSSKKMFGGYGIFYQKKMFGMVTPKGQYYLKTDDANVQDYIDLNAEKHSRMPYYEIPDEVLKNEENLILWVNKSIQIIINNPNK